MSRSTPARRGAVCGLLAAIVMVALPVNARASEERAPESPPSVVQTGKFPRPVGRYPSSAVWHLPSLGRAFFLTGRGAGRGFSGIVAFDDASGAVVAESKLDPPAFHFVAQVGNLNNGRANVMTVDDLGGRLFVAYSVRAPLEPNPEQSLTQGSVCAAPGSPELSCVGGVMVLDGTSLQREGPLMNLEIITASGVATAPQPLAMHYSPARGPGDAEKVLLLVADYALNLSNTAHDGDSPRVLLTQTPHYVVQFDVASGRQEWVVSVDVCKGSRNSSDDKKNPEYRVLPNPAALYRRPSVTDPMVVVACHAGSDQIGTIVRIPLDDRGVPAGLPVEVVDPARAMEAPTGGVAGPPQTWISPSASPQVTFGPNNVLEMVADPLSDRMLLRNYDGPSGEESDVWWVFDAKLGGFIGTVGIGKVHIDNSVSAFDQSSGRLYVLAKKGAAGGLFTADIRRSPVPQALVYPQFASLQLGFANASRPMVQMGVLQGSEGVFPRLLVPDSVGASALDTANYHVIEDRTATSVDVPFTGYEGRTLDVPERDGVTTAAFDGAARGYGARTLLVGGFDPLVRLGPVDAVGTVYGCNEGKGRPLRVALDLPCGRNGVPALPEGCVYPNRDIVLGFVGPDGANVVDASGARGSAEPVRVDSGTAADLEGPVSRCAETDWDDLGNLPLGGISPTRAAGDEPRIAAPWSGRAVDCTSGEDSEAPPAQDKLGDVISGAFAAAVQCDNEEASGFAYVRGNQAGLVNVGEALSSFRIYRDPGRGVVSRVESVARGLDFGGAVRIDMVRGSAESWANGRQFEPSTETSYEANCDIERTAGTCFRRQLFGVSTPAYRCGPCGDEQRAIAALNRVFGANGKAALRDPDPELARGADNGFIAAIAKPVHERAGDLVLNNDLLQTVLPTLEIVRFTSPNRLATRGGPRGRQIYQFAGVEVSSSYSIQCLLVYDKESNTCAATKEPPASLTLSLTDPQDTPLAGGAFEVRRDADTDGLVGLADPLLPDGACVTAADGIGTCVFEQLEAGPYLVSQVAAPPGYGKVAEPYAVELAGGESRTVAFQNTSDMSRVQVSATDEAGTPLPGAVFAVYADPDGDGKVAGDAQPAATCTTGQDGSCAMQVPAGSYVLVQSAAPGGLAPIEPLAFTLSSAGQTAAVGVVNYPPDVAASASPPPAPAPVTYTAAPQPVITETVEHGAESAAPVVDEPPVSLPDAIGGTIVRIIRVPGEALRLLARGPRESFAWTATLALFALALLAVSRRRQYMALVGLPGLGGSGPSGSGGTVPPGPGRGSGPGRGAQGPSLGSPPVHRRDDGPQPVARYADAQAAGRPPTVGAGRPASQGTAVLELPSLVAGAAPSALDHSVVDTVVATGSVLLKALVRGRLTDEHRVRVVAEATSLASLREVLGRHAPEVLVVDLSLPTAADLGVCELLAELHPAERTVGLIPAQRSPRALAERGYAAGIAGLLAAEDLVNGQLVYTIRSVAAGKLCYGPAVQSALFGSRAIRPRPRGRRQSPMLSERELEVAQLMVEGLSRRQIADRLFLSEATVKLHIRAARTKLGATNPSDRAHLRRRMEELGILGDDGSAAS